MKIYKQKKDLADYFCSDHAINCFFTVMIFAMSLLLGGAIMVDQEWTEIGDATIKESVLAKHPTNGHVASGICASGPEQQCTF